MKAVAVKVTSSRLTSIETGRVIRREPVRTLDDIQLSSALFLRQSFPDLIIASVDERVRANAELLGFELEPHRE